MLPFQLFINAEGSHLMIKYTLTSLSSKVDREYTHKHVYRDTVKMDFDVFPGPR